MRFKISGTLPAPWEDFVAQEPAVPNITICTKENDVEFGDGVSDPVSTSYKGPKDLGWEDIVVDCEAITLDIARTEIAKYLGLKPEDIEIEQTGVVQAV